MKTFLRILFLVSALLFAQQRNSDAQTTPPREYQVKAAFLYNFAQFIEWPARAFPETSSPIAIGVLGNDALASDLDRLAKSEKVNNHQLLVQRYKQVDEIKACHILFVGQAGDEQLERIFTKLRNRSTLTVGESDDSAGCGGAICFVTRNHKVRLTINLQAAKAANLTVSSKLLRVAKLVSCRQG